MDSDLQPWVLQQRRMVGDRLRHHRLTAGLTQERLAELAGLDRKTINRVEQGHRTLDTDQIITVAFRLGITADRLFRDD